MMGGRNEQANLRQRSRDDSRSAGMVITGKRSISSSRTSTSIQEPSPNTVANNESDTNADTCYLSTNFVVLSYTNRTADVYPYDKSYAPMQNVPIVSGATAWDCAEDGRTYILVFHESLYYGEKLPHSLINPNQIR